MKKQNLRYGIYFIIFFLLVGIMYIYNSSQHPSLRKITPLAYRGSEIITDFNQSDIDKYETSAGNYDSAVMASNIVSELKKSFSNGSEKSLPVAANWNVGIPEYSDGLDPMYMINKLSGGEHVVPAWKLAPYYNDTIGLDYYEASVKKAATLGLPLIFILPSPESALIKDDVYFSMDKTNNPNVITVNGTILSKLSPFAPSTLWKEVGEQWTTTSLMAQLQEWYPNPPLVIFVDEDSSKKLLWSEVETSERYLLNYPHSQSDQFKRTLVNAKWIEKYRQLHKGFKEGLTNSFWKKNIKFVSRNQLALKMGVSKDWLNYATTTNLNANVWPLTTDAITINFELDEDKTDISNNGLEALVNNLPFMLDEAKQVNPTFNYELSINANGKINNLARYRGYAQFALWFLRPSIIRQGTVTTLKEDISPLFQEVVDSVDLINNNVQLADFWKNGKLVRTGQSPFTNNIPEKYNHVSRWFLLKNNAKQTVWSFALVKGESPNRKWLLYAQSPESNLTDVIVTIPNFKDVLVDINVKGSFYILDENSSNSYQISDKMVSSNINNDSMPVVDSFSFEKFKFNFRNSDIEKWASNGQYTVNYMGFSNEKMYDGKEAYKIDISFEDATYCYFSVPLNEKVPAIGNLQVNAVYSVGKENEGQIAFGNNLTFYPSTLSGIISTGRNSPSFDEWKSSFVSINNEAPLVKQRVFTEYVSGLNEDDTGTYVNKLGIYLYGKSHQRIVLYIGDLNISGYIPDVKEYNNQILENWKSAENSLQSNLSEISEQLNILNTKFNNITVNQFIANKTKEIALNKIIQLKEQVKIAGQRKYLLSEEKAQLNSSVSTLQYAIKNLPKIDHYESQKEPFIIYMPNAILNSPQLPSTLLVNGDINSTMEIKGCQNEFLAKTFSIYTLQNFKNLTFKISSFTNNISKKSLSSDIIDMKFVKRWYQAGSSSKSIRYVNKRVMTPELLLNNNALIKVDEAHQDNYLLSNGKYINISRNEDLSHIQPLDTKTLQPIALKINILKQLWITAHIPAGAEPGDYSGKIEMYDNDTYQGKVDINITVLPFSLEESKIKQSMYYRGIVNRDNVGSLGSDSKTLVQYEADLKNLKEHGILYPTLYQRFNETNLKKVLDIRKKLNFPTDSIYILGLKAGTDSSPEGLDKLQQNIEKWKNLLRTYNYDKIYIYGVDEARNEKLLEQRDVWKTVRDNGVKIFTSCYLGAYEVVGDLLDVAVFNGILNKKEAEKYHAIGHEIFSYENPQMGLEKPETYRRNYGLALWKNNYDGAMDYAYQHPFGSAWNDFDSTLYKDHMMAYPTMNGFINTVQAEGYREGVNDLRYLATLQNAISLSQNTTIANEAQVWLDNLSLDENLDSIRQKMIDYILKLQ